MIARVTPGLRGARLPCVRPRMNVYIWPATNITTICHEHVPDLMIRLITTRRPLIVHLLDLRIFASRA